MATYTVDVPDKVAMEDGGKVVVVFSDPAQPGVLYYTTPCPDTSEERKAAVERAIAVRKAAGLDYPGRPATAKESMTVTV